MSKRSYTLPSVPVLYSGIVCLLSGHHDIVRTTGYCAATPSHLLRYEAPRSFTPSLSFVLILVYLSVFACRRPTA